MQARVLIALCIFSDYGGHMQNNIAHIKARVRAAIAEGQSAPSLARRAGLHRNALYGCDSPDWNPKSDTLEKLDLLLQSESSEQA